MEIFCVAQETETGALYQTRRVGWEGYEREVHNGVDICIPMADACWGLTENNKSL